MELSEIRVRELAKGKEVNIGIDVHKESWHITIRSDGEELFKGRIRGSYEELEKQLKRLSECKIKVAYEAGPSGFWLYDKLTEVGIETIVTPPSLIPMEIGNKVKTDKRDSSKLAKLLEKGMLKKVHVLSEESRGKREVLRTRRQLVEHKNDVARQIKSKLLFHGIESPFVKNQHWGKKYIKWLKELELKQTALKTSINALVALYEYLKGMIKELTKEIVFLSKTEKYKNQVELLKTVPGIGTLTAMEIIIEIGEIKRFGRAEQLSSYLGMTPSEYSTGGHIRQGRITHGGNKRLRSALVESSWILISKDRLMRQKYETIKYRRGAKRAITAIARRLSSIIRIILIKNEAYRYEALLKRH
ncbi:MAG: IS110 family transposase [Nitrospirae bacterium YQR-1]